MIYALVDGARSRAVPRGRASCPDCSQTMIAKCGPIVCWHWAHAVGSDCEPWSEPESAWHLGWKERFLLAGCQVEVPIVRDGERHRADVVLPGGRIVELQHGYLSPDAIWQREAFYRDVVWLYDAERFWDRVVIRDKAFKWLHAARSMQLHGRPRLWHVGEVVWLVEWIRSYARGTFGGMSRSIGAAELPWRMVETEQEQRSGEQDPCSAGRGVGSHVGSRSAS